MEPKMEDAIKSFSGSVAAKVRIQSKEECTVEFLVDKLRSVLGGDGEKITVERYRQAIEAHKQQHPEMPEDEGVVVEESKALEPSRQRMKMKVFAPGDVVE